MLAVNQLTGFGFAGAPTVTLRPSGSPFFQDAKVASTLTGDTGGWSNVNQRHVIESLSSGGDLVRLVLEGASTEGIMYDALWIGEQASSGDVYDMKSSSPAPTQMLVSGSGSFFVPPGETVETDALAFTIDPAKTYVVAAHYATASDDGLRQNSDPTGIISYWKAASASEASTANVTGYTNGPGGSRGIKKLQVESLDAFFSPTVS